jgi:hypothetical protein
MSLFDKLKCLFKSKDKTLFESETEIWNEITLLENKLQSIDNKKEQDAILAEITKKRLLIKELSEKNPAKLKYRIKELQDELKQIDDLKKESRALVRYYEQILRKYGPNIVEDITAENLKSLVKSETMDLDVLLDSIKPNNYNYDKDYLEVMDIFYDYIKENIYLLERKQKLKFWLDSTDIFKTRAGDSYDLAIFICAIMHALGDFSARICVVELDDFSTHAYVKTKYKNRVLIFDPFNSETINDYLGL